MLINGDSSQVTPEHLAYRRLVVHQENMKLYNTRFEEDSTVNYQDLWAYISEKISKQGDFKQMNETDEITRISHML